MADYLNILYNKDSKPYTSYPKKLVKYLFDNYAMKRGMKMLEPGVGRGEHLREFKDLGIVVKGLDISHESIALSPDLDIDLFDADQNVWSYDDDTFDIVYSKSFIEHLNNPLLYINEAYRVLKPGGVLLTHTPDWEVNYKKFFDDYTHVSPFTIYSLENIKASGGFQDITLTKFRQLPIVWKFPKLRYLCNTIAPLVPVRTKNSFLRWSRELMLIGFGIKPECK